MRKPTYNLGVLLRDSQLSEAETLFRTALRLDPRLVCAYRELGYLLGERDEAADLEAFLRKAIELDFTDSLAHIYGNRPGYPRS